MEQELYLVIDDKNFYEGMVGEMIIEFEKTILLDIGMGKNFGGKHRVMFYKNQLKKHQ